MRKLLFLLITVVLCASSALADNYAIRIIQSGESLSAIAYRYNIPVDVLMSFNNLGSHLLHPGDIIKIPFMEATGGIAQLAPKPPPGFISHSLSAGETLSDLTARYNLSLEAIIGANPDISSLDLLPIGLELLIPPRPGLVITLEASQDIRDIISVYELEPTEFLRVNKIEAPQDIKSGMMLFLPGIRPAEALERLARVREEENRYVWPLHGRLTSYFGRRNLGMGTSGFHAGLDIAAPTGTAVIASRSGTVSYAGWSSRGYGNLVKISHAGGAETWYAHHSKILVSVGQYVNQGEVIALVGSTGLSTGPHVHFELHEAGRAVDPLTYLR